MKIPLHRMAIVFPLGLLGTSFLFDLAWLATGRSELAVDAWWLILAGVIGAVVAGVFGALAWRALPRGTHARKLGALHGIGNVVVALLFLGSWFLRRGAPAHPAAIALVLSAAGVLLTLFTCWLGGQLVTREQEAEA